MGAVETDCSGRNSTHSGTSSPWRAVLAGALAGAFLTSVGLAAMPAARGLVGAAVGFECVAAHREAANPAKASPRQPLPLAWRWAPPGVDVDRMFRQPR